MTNIPDLERILYFSGELLTADDLTASDGNQQALRWLHNRTLHHWGIGTGLDVHGNRGDTQVLVSPGYAIDSLGREIILSSPFAQPIPAVGTVCGGPGAMFYLVANYVDDANQTTEEQRDAPACGTGGAVRLSNDPAILWKTPDRLNVGIDVILALIAVRNCVLDQAPSLTVRRYASDAQNVSLRAGSVRAFDLAWKVWQVGGINTGFTAAIDTSPAKFASIPTYYVHIVGNRSNGNVLVVDFISIANPTAIGFTLQVALPAGTGSVNPASVTNAVTGPKLFSDLGWTVAWMGVEA